MAPRMYELEINRQTGTLNRLSLAADPGGINLTHRSTLTAFGAMTYTPKESRATLEPSGPPMNVEAVHLDERRAYAPVVEEGPGRIVGRNAATGHSITYELGDEGFDVWLEGDLPFADQVGLDLDVAFMDIDQDASELYQYTVQCPYCSEDRSVCYVYLSRPTAPGMLVVALTPALWRLRYGRGGFGEEGWIPPAYATPLHAVLGLQMLHRVDSALDPTSSAGPVRQGVRIRFPADIHEARQYMIREMGLPLLWAPTLGCEEGGTLRFAAGGPVGQAELVGPDGESSPVELTRVDDQTQVGEVTLPAEGFYSVVAKGGEGYTSDLTLRCGAPWLQALRRSVEEKAPVASFNSEGLFWAESMALARGWFGPHEHWDRCLYDMLVRIHMQGLAGEDLPSLPAPEPTDLLEKAKMAEGWYLRAPIPEAHTCAGKTFSPFHSFRNDRVQDTATLIELFLFGADAYGEEAFYQQAVRLCEAMVRDNIDETGRIYLVSFHDPNTTRDYTTVLPPAQHLVQVWMEMVKRGDERAGALREVLVKVGDYLVRRGMEFPTEGPQAHLRWTEDGSISCTALSLLYLYSHVEAKPAYLEFARQILDFHESWGMDAPDVRMHGSSFRYWETQWENDQEGRAINAGHPWTLWRAEALYWDAYVSGNARRLLQSWNGYWSNRCKFMPDGTTYSCFTPDYIPDRPRRFELVHSYPRTSDVSIACYLWPRVAETWLRTCAVIDTAAAGCKAVSGPIALNARLDPAGASDATLTPQAPFFERLFLLGEEIGPVRVEADRAIEVLADGPVEVLRGRGEGLDRPHAMRVQSEDGIIRLRRG